MPSLTREQVRAVDRCAIEILGVPSVVLMENAGRNAAHIAWDVLARARARKVAIVAGAGNNAGDGFVIARHLDNFGGDVTSFLTAPEGKFTPDAATNFRILQQMNCAIEDLHADLTALGERLAEFDLVIDALGGTGIQGALHGQIAQAVEAVNQAARPVLAVDIPTGLDCDTGQAQGPIILADATVTFVARKVGFDNPASTRYTGPVHVVDIGVPAEPTLERARKEGLLAQPSAPAQGG